MGKGRVYIVGAGPGDPSLLTLRGLRVLQRANVVVHDRLISGEILKHVPSTAILVDAGKKSHYEDGITQDDINRTLITQARKGRRVVRLKGGDPFLFARGGEEAKVLRANNIPFEIVPGVTSALAAPAYAGIPLTDRNHSSSVAIVTGHESSSKSETKVRWPRLAKAVDTIVILMGASTFTGKVSRELIRGGMKPQTPVAAIRWGTTHRQETSLFTLADAAKGKTNPLISSPCVIVVGQVAKFSKVLDWFSRGIGVKRSESQVQEPTKRETRKSG